jgi:hypothetical protein
MNNEVKGLRTIVRAELKRRGQTWDRKAKQAAPNKAEAERLAARQRGHAAILASASKGSNPAAFTMPGSYRK